MLIKVVVDFETFRWLFVELFAVLVETFKGTWIAAADDLEGFGAMAPAGLLVLLLLLELHGSSSTVIWFDGVAARSFG